MAETIVRGAGFRCSCWCAIVQKKKGLKHYLWLLYKLLIHKPTLNSLVVGEKSMNTGGCKGLEARSWRDLYQAAIYESDVNRLPDRIADAETALVMRARELVYASGDKIEEEESLDDAMFILHALRSSLRNIDGRVRKSSAISATPRALVVAAPASAAEIDGTTQRKHLPESLDPRGMGVRDPSARLKIAS
jgi:hypothetical protein